MAKLGDVILRDTRANQPAAGVEGRLYYVTDESLLERDSGVAWENVESGVGSDAGDITYTPTVVADWDSDADPGDLDDALNQLAERVTDIEEAGAGGGGGGDAADITYTPTVLADWDSDADPGNVDGALDQLAERVDDLEGAGGGSADHAYYSRLAAFLEPDAIEIPQVGAFSYAVAADETKYLLLGWELQMGSAGRIDIRDPRVPLALRGVTLQGVRAASPKSMAMLVDPTLVTYTDARDTYFDRLLALDDLPTKYIPVTAQNQNVLWLPGPYGSIITQVTCFDLSWVALRSSFDSGGGFPIDYEIDDANEIRFAHTMRLPVTKAFVNQVMSGAGTAQGSEPVGGSICYVNLPATWSVVVDPNSYDFRDDFMGAALDTDNDWTVTQSTAGNVEINTNFAWCKALGNQNWGTNGAISKVSIARAVGKVFQADIYWGDATVNDGGSIGFHDGAGLANTDFAHGIRFNNNTIYVDENANNRGAVGSGYTAGLTYRVRITLEADGAATYEIQGGSQYPPIGGATWTDITPGTTSSATNTLYAAFSIYGAVGTINYVGDVRMW